LTKYGFKDLFTQFNYNSNLPYASQVNPNAELYMQDYLQKHQNHLIKMKNLAVPYFNLIDNIFSQYGLPTELKYLAVIESNLKTSATSWVGAAGPWQFMPATARDYGLTVNSSQDDRRDYFKSTHAAARLLLYLYKDLHDWLLVIAAYNGGPGRVYSAIRKSRSSNFWNLQYYLPQESRNHVKKFIATHYIMESKSNEVADKNLIGKSNSKLTEIEKMNCVIEKISGKYNSILIANYISMDIKIFNKYNPNFDEVIANNGVYELTLPKEKMEIFIKNKYPILNHSVQWLLNNNQ
jgi:membrane-bound lytic murein transglycosylase D